MFRRRRDRERPSPVVDVAGLAPAWRRAVEDAMDARRRFAEMTARVPTGPLRQRLDGMAEQLDAAVLRCWDTATRAQAAEEVARTLDPDEATAELKAARRRLERLGDHERADRSAMEAEVEALSLRHGAVQRALNAVDEASDRLRMLNVRLDAAVAHALELVLAPAASDQADRVDAELRDVVGQLDSLRSALGELDT